MRGSHGGQRERAARAWGCAPEAILDLSTGLHPAGPPTWLGKWLCRHAAHVGHYPDPDGEPARSALAQTFGVDPHCVLVAAGAQALIEVVFSAMGWRSVAIHQPSYVEALRCARRAGVAVQSFALGEPPPAADALWVTDPHNPSGARCPLPRERNGVVDESYLAFGEREKVGITPQWLRLGSLTKVFAIPGLRLGYAVGAPEQIERLARWLPPWPATTLALYLLPELLVEAPGRDAALAAGRERLAALLRRHGFAVRESAASFILTRPAGRPAPDFSNRRILVRSFPEWPELHGWLRLGIPGGEADWDRLEAALCL